VRGETALVQEAGSASVAPPAGLLRFVARAPALPQHEGEGAAELRRCLALSRWREGPAAAAVLLCGGAGSGKRRLAEQWCDEAGLALVQRSVGSLPGLPMHAAESEATATRTLLALVSEAAAQAGDTVKRAAPPPRCDLESLE